MGAWCSRLLFCEQNTQQFEDVYTCFSTITKILLTLALQTDLIGWCSVMPWEYKLFIWRSGWFSMQVILFQINQIDFVLFKDVILCGNLTKKVVQNLCGLKCLMCWICNFSNNCIKLRKCSIFVIQRFFFAMLQWHCSISFRESGLSK